MKRLNMLFVAALSAFPYANSADYFIAPNGNDSNSGAIDAPFASLVPVQAIVKPGDNVFFRDGTYRPQAEDAMGERIAIYSCAYILDKSGTPNAPITYSAYPGEQPVFDMSNFKPDGKRVAVFYVSGSWLHIKGLEVIGTQVMISDGSNTQSECFSNRGGSHNVYENLKMHHGMGIGWYLVDGGDNLVLNCDAWCNYDSANGGGNVDGFGCHPSKGDTGNVLRGCRAWWNSDDGFDLIHADESVRIDGCWAFFNGYKPATFDSAADGNGIKGGGYGMKNKRKIPQNVPSHVITNCLAYANKASGIYSNHHLAGNVWINNTAMANRWNYNMVNRKSVDEIVDVPGYGHTLVNNLSYMPRLKDLHNVDANESVMNNNSFDSDGVTPTATDFISTDATELMLPRGEDGSLPAIKFLQPTDGSVIAVRKMGHSFHAGYSFK